MLGKNIHHITLPRRAQWKVFKVINKHCVLFVNLVKIFKALPSSTVKPLFVWCIRCGTQTASTTGSFLVSASSALTEGELSSLVVKVDPCFMAGESPGHSK